MQSIILSVNGRKELIQIEPWHTLAHVLRENLQLTGTKIGCGKGDCGSCTVLINGKAVRSCIYPAVKAEGKEIVTIEGLKGEEGDLHPLQKAFINHHAVQCGYCTPGMILTAKAFLDEEPDPSEEQIKKALDGNICRCTGYAKIVEAVKAYADESRNNSAVEK